MKRIIVILLCFPFFVILAQTSSKIKVYVQNNTGYPAIVSDFIIDGNNNFVFSHYKYNELNTGGITLFDGTKWYLTSKGEKDFPFVNGVKVFFSPNNKTTYVYGSKQQGDYYNQYYRLAYFDEQQNKWIAIGDTVTFTSYNSLEDLVVTNSGEIYVADISGFFRVESDTSIALYPPDNRYFHADKILLKPDNSMYLIKNSVDGWGNTFTGIYSFYGVAPDTLKEPLDSIKGTIDATLDNNGNVWLLGNENLVKYSNGTEENYPNPFFTQGYGHYTDFVFDAEINALWVITIDMQSFFKFDIATSTWTKFDFINPVDNYSSNLQKVIVSGNYLYILMNELLAKVNKTSGILEDYYYTDNTGIAGDYNGAFSSVFIDKNQHYWINSLNGGIAEFNGDIWITHSSKEINNRLAVTSMDACSDSKGTIYTVGDSLRYFKNGEWTTVRPDESIAPYFYGVSIAADKSDNIWIADKYDGLCKYKDGIFTYYKTSNSDIKGNDPNKILVDKNGNIWIGFGSSGFSVFDGNTFNNYQGGTGEFPNNSVVDLTEAPDGTIWASFYQSGVAKYQNGVWTSYTTANSDIPTDLIYNIAVDKNNKLWMKYGSTSDTLGLLSFDGTNWNKIILDSNQVSGIGAITIDDNNNIFVAVNYVGLYIYNENQVILGIDNNTDTTPNAFKLNQNYPNPFNPTTTITFTLKNSEKVRLQVYNILGQVVADLIDEEMTAGNHKVVFNASNLTSGIYFYKLQTGSFSDIKKMMLLR